MPLQIQIIQLKVIQFILFELLHQRNKLMVINKMEMEFKHLFPLLQSIDKLEDILLVKGKQMNRIHTKIGRANKRMYLFLHLWTETDWQTLNREKLHLVRIQDLKSKGNKINSKQETLSNLPFQISNNNSNKNKLFPMQYHQRINLKWELWQLLASRKFIKQPLWKKMKQWFLAIDILTINTIYLMELNLSTINHWKNKLKKRKKSSTRLKLSMTRQVTNFWKIVSSNQMREIEVWINMELMVWEFKLKKVIWLQWCKIALLKKVSELLGIAWVKFRKKNLARLTRVIEDN
jgi:hypothetical protein